MRTIEFHNREKETKEIRAILDSRPTLITFIYGPINSGKTELITHTIEELPDEYVVFYINLRTKFLASYDDFIESLFEMEMESEGALKKGKETLAELVSSVTKVAGIPINKEFLDYVFKDNKPKNAFSYILKLFEEVRATGKQPVLIIDELQKIGDVNVNGSLIYELFNFFIDLTKEAHLAQVFVATSDSLFMESVYSEAMLEGRCRYLRVDDFDEATTAAFLEGHGLTDDEKAVAWNCCGGKPICLVELVNTEEDRKGKAEEMLKIRKGQIEEIVYSLEARDKEMFDAVSGILSEFIGKEKVGYKYISDEIKFLVGKNIIFADSMNKELRAQSKLNLLAVREVMKDV
uniref:Putative ATP-binding protein n=1 Tax=Candidatus Methanogaster sp. ANME-2c ERB4 TaxID=2759911 RepID=A0A7G9Y724_9EURY|nr:putative ATP-binding protein [Methanosarcinales archaeon ANME-2c ERB4]QNO50616.1 putative ATP-binding protein [Methanosarcinales archaeon ANME-2c ERB4]